MAQRRYVLVSFEAPSMGIVEESLARNEIVNKVEEVGGLGWELAWSHPMIVFKDFEDDGSFKAALHDLRQRIGGVEYAKAFP